MQMKIEFTNEELFMLSDGIIALIYNSCEAQKLIHDDEVLSVIKLYQDKLVKLNVKICSNIEEEKQNDSGV